MNKGNKFEFNSIRNITCPDDKANGRLVYAGKAPYRSFLELPDGENVREYLVEAQGKKRHSPSQVHLRIRETLRERPQDFCVLNNGITIICRGIEVDDQKRIAVLDTPSIINGSQTQGELKRFADRGNEDEVFVTYEIVVCDDDDLVADISIARNFQNDVAAISIAGRLGQFDDLEKRLKSHDSSVKLKRSETDRSSDFLDSEKLIQVLTALIPNELWPRKEESPNKAVAYNGKSQCLKQFSDIHEKAANGDTRASELYQFFLDVAVDAWVLYRNWKTHQAFRGSGLRAIERDETGRVLDVPDGIIFPILAAHSVFMVKATNGWQLAIPVGLDDDDLAKIAKVAYMEISGSNPGTMGKSRACYSQMLQYTSLLKKLSR